MKDNINFRKRNPYASVFALGVAGVMLSAPVFAQSQSGSSVTVDEAAPEVELQQPAPKVTAEQSQTKVRVETGDPQVSVDQPKPDVSINQQEPEVAIEQGEPNVNVNEAEPQVNVNQAEPEVTINSAEPEVEIVNRDAQGNNKEQEQEQEQSLTSSDRSESSDSVSAQSLEQAQLSNLEGKTVVTAAGEELGDVQDIVASTQGSEAGFVVSVGGFFGIGDTEILVPASDAQLRDDQIVWQTQRGKDQLKRANEYQDSQYESITDRYNTLSEAQGSQVSSRMPE